MLLRRQPEARPVFFGGKLGGLSYPEHLLVGYSGDGKGVDGCGGSRQVKMRAVGRAGQPGRELDSELLLSGMIGDQRVMALTHDQLHIRRLDFIDLGLRAEQRDDRPLVREALRFVINHAAGLIAFERELIARGQKRGFDGWFSFFRRRLALGGLPERLQLSVRKRHASLAQIRDRDRLSREGKRSESERRQSDQKCV